MSRLTRRADDNELFRRISNMKKDIRSHEYYKQSLKENAIFERDLMNINTGYTTSRSEERLRYEENVSNKTKYQREMKRMTKAVVNHESFEVDIGDDSEIQYAFTQVLRNIRKLKSSEWKPIIYGYDLNGWSRIFSINKELDLEVMIRCILGEITVEEYSSDCDPGLIGWDYI